MFLHKDNKEIFSEIVTSISSQTGIPVNFIEKDYYVTILLREFSKRSDKVVFKGGTSLSKAFRVIDRFSEDVDITFTEHIGSARRKKLKYQFMQPISEELGLPIKNWSYIESDKDYNHYDFSYESITESVSGIFPWVKVETALMSYSFPTEEREISNYIYESLKDSQSDILFEYDLLPFRMRVQSLSRTFIDKMFAICDYFLLGKAKRYSRHLYDLYKLDPYVDKNDDFADLIFEVRQHRMTMDEKRTPSAHNNVNIYETVRSLCDTDFYKDDYSETTKKLISDDVDYQTVITFYRALMEKYFG